MKQLHKQMTVTIPARTLALIRRTAAREQRTLSNTVAWLTLKGIRSLDQAHAPDVLETLPAECKLPKPIESPMDTLKRCARS